MTRAPRPFSAPAALLVLGLAACGAPPERATASRTPLAIEEQAPVASLASGSVASARLASVSVAPGGSAVAAIDLATVLALAGEKANAVRLAREALAEADARADAAGAALLPSLVLGGSFFRHDGTIQDVQGHFLETTKQAFFLGATGEVVVDVGGSVLGLLRERQRRDAASAELEAVEQERVLAAALGWFELVGSEAAVGIARDALDHARGFHDVADSRQRNGLGLALDTLRAEADVARARQALIAAEERVRVASIRLAAVLRLDPAVQLESSEREVRPITFVAAETPADRLVATALANHPEIVAARRRVAAADLEDDAARVGPFLPVLRAGAGGLQGGLGVGGPELGSIRDREDYSVGLELRLTGLGFGEVARARATAARLRAERVREDDVRESVVALVLEAREQVRARTASIDVAREELRAADEARTIARKRLEQGQGLAIDVLAAEEERTRAATHLVEAIVGANGAQYRLLATLGERPAK